MDYFPGLCLLLLATLTQNAYSSIDLIAAHSIISENRLPKTLSPINYNLELLPDILQGNFSGKVIINISWQEASNEIILHAHQNLHIVNDKIKVVQYAPDHDSAILGIIPPLPVTIKVNEVERTTKTSVLKITLNRSVKKGAECQLELHFSGKLYNDTSEALFRSTYKDTASGETKWFLASYFRPNLARRVFPCFDEPHFKASFQLRVGRLQKMTALSNMPRDASEPMKDREGWFWDKFQQSPPMSTFTLGLTISELVALKPLENAVTQIRVWSRPDFAAALEGVQEKLNMSLSILEDYWEVAYPLQKLDCVALPNYQATRPADHWGLLLFKESDLSGKGSWHISQELAYQWIGGLVTPFWWSDAHINNALIRYVTAYATLKMSDGAETFNNWPMTTLYSIYYEFSKRYPHGKSTAIKQDSASAKTELLFRMVNYTIGEKAFRYGVNAFISRRLYGTFFADDIWRELTEQAHRYNKIDENMTINEVAASWITKDRLPVLNVTRNYEDRTALLGQRVYLRERPHDVPDQETFLWWIPIIMVTQNDLNFHNSTPVKWMRKQRWLQLNNLPNSNEFIIINPEEIGPFPVNYDEKNWGMLAKFLCSKDRLKIPVNTRAKLLHDAWNLAYAGDLSFMIALDMTLFLKDEREHLAWDPVFTMIDHIGRHIDGSFIHEKFQTYVRLLLTPLYEELGNEPKENESQDITDLRRSAKVFLCQAGYKPCIREAQEAFKKWMDAENPDDGNPVANQYICPVFKWGTREEWEFGLERVVNFPASRRQNERTYLLKTLSGCPTDKWKFQKLLNITVLEENGNFTESDITLIFSMLTGNGNGYTSLFQFLQHNWVAIKAKFENKPHLWNSLVTSATTAFKTKEGLDLVSKLYVERQGDFGTAEFIVERALKNIKEETKWGDENLPVIQAWLNKYIQSNLDALAKE